MNHTKVSNNKKTINISNSKIDKIKRFFISVNSKDYQRMLAGVRIYFSLMTQRSFINSILITLFGVAVSFTIFSYALFYNRLPLTPYLFILPFGFFLLPMIIFLMIVQYRELDFKPLKGYLVSYRNPTFLIFSFLILTLLVVSINTSNLIEFIVFEIGYFFIIQLFTILIQMNSLKISSLISYAKEKLNDSINIKAKKKPRILTAKFELFYYSIYTYYRKLIREIGARYKDDILLYFQIDKIPMLASQIHTKDAEKREELNNILTKLEQVTPMEKPDEYIKIMEDIDNSYRKSLSLPDDAMIIRNLFRERTLSERIKLYLIPLIPIISIVVSIYFNYLK